MTTRKIGSEIRTLLLTRPLHGAIACALVLAAAGCGQDGVDEAALEQTWSSEWPHNVHERMTELAIIQAHLVTGNFYEKAQVLDGNDDTDHRESLKGSQYHFMRTPYISSRKACKNAQQAMIDSVKKAFSYFTKGNKSSFSWWVGVATHTLQDSTCPAHAKRTGPELKELTKLCVGSNDPALSGWCRHYASGDFDWGYDSAEYKAGFLATIGLLVGIYDMYESGAYRSASGIENAMLDILENNQYPNNGLENFGYAICDTLSNNDTLPPPVPDPCGCKGTEICCDPVHKICVEPPVPPGACRQF